MCNVIPLATLSLLPAPLIAHVEDSDPAYSQLRLRFRQLDHRDCGQIALFFVATAYGREPDFESIVRLLPYGPNGSSIDALRRAGDHLGLPMQVYRLHPDHLIRFEKPVICLLESSSANHASHFVVVTDIDESEVLVFDPATCSMGRTRRHRFDACFSGLVAVPIQSTGGRMSLLIASSLICGILMLFHLVGLLYRRRV